MRLDYDTKQNNRTIQEVIDDIIANNKYFFSIIISGETFIYRPITRLEYKNILDENITEEDKKDLICKKCLLFPENYDFDNCIAGIPEQLSKDIIEKSAIDPVSVISLINIGKEEMQDLISQIICIISNEFPAYKIEEIESWNMYELIEMFSKANWKRKFRAEYGDLDVEEFILETLIDSVNGNKEEDYEDISEQRIQEQENLNNEQNETVKSTTPQSNKMSQETYREYLEFAKKHPDIDISADAAFTGYDDNIKVDDLPPALRPGWG